MLSIYTKPLINKIDFSLWGMYQENIYIAVLTELQCLAGAGSYPADTYTGLNRKRWHKIIQQPGVVRACSCCQQQFTACFSGMNELPGKENGAMQNSRQANQHEYGFFHRHFISNLSNSPLG